MKKEELLAFICEMFGCKSCNDMILRQIHNYVNEYGYAYKDIARALSYYVDVQGNKLDPRYGIAIVKFVMAKARAYYAEQEKLKQQQIEEAKKAKKSSNVIIKCKPNRKVTIKRNKIDIENI